MCLLLKIVYYLFIICCNIQWNAQYNCKLFWLPSPGRNCRGLSVCLFRDHWRTAGWILTKFGIHNLPPLTRRMLKAICYSQIIKGNSVSRWASNSFSIFAHQLVIRAQKYTRQKLCNIIILNLFSLVSFLKKKKEKKTYKIGSRCVCVCVCVCLCVCVSVCVCVCLCVCVKFWSPLSISKPVIRLIRNFGDI